nr:reverse transcriptase domain-containing protein [Tanacetum cinerariifolium]
MKTNEAILRDMQTQMTNMKIELQNEFKYTIDERTNKIGSKNNQIINILTNMQMQNSLGSGSLPNNTIANPRADLKAITTRSGVSYNGPLIPPLFSSLPKVVERVPEVIKDTMVLHMPKFALMFKGLLNSKEKLLNLATTLVNKNCSAVILKKLPEKLGDPRKFLIPCDFSELVKFLALADLGASINVMPLSIWKKLSLPELTPTLMILELADQSTTRPAGIAEDVFVKVGNDAESVNQTDVIDVACEEYVQEVLRLLEIPMSGNPTPTSDPIISSSSPSFTLFKGSDFILEEIETFLQTPNELSNLNDDYYDTEGDILYIEKLLNEDPSLNLPPV